MFSAFKKQLFQLLQFENLEVQRLKNSSGSSLSILIPLSSKRNNKLNPNY